MKPDASQEAENYEKGKIRKKVLVVDDDMDNLLLIHQFLRKLNIEIITAHDGVEAVRFCESNYVDLILMDLKMPSLDGYQAAAEILKKNRHIRIIAQTAYLNEKDKAIECGFTDLIVKPYRRQQLISLINSYI